MFEEERIGALAFFPLFSGGLLLGKFMLYYPGPHTFTEAETRLAQGIAHQVAFAVERGLAQQERERILGIVSHDLKNPLSAVSVAATTLLRQDIDPNTAKSVRRIASGASRRVNLRRAKLEQRRPPLARQRSRRERRTSPLTWEASAQNRMDRAGWFPCL